MEIIKCCKSGLSLFLIPEMQLLNIYQHSTALANQIWKENEAKGGKQNEEFGKL